MQRTVLRMLDEAAEKWPDTPYALRKTDAGYVPVSFREARERSREGSRTENPRNLKALGALFKLPETSA